MKSTGVVRKVDGLGRVVIPIELRRVLDIDVKDSLEIYIDNDCILLKKYKDSCVFCDREDSLLPFKNKHICLTCMDEIKL